MANANSRGGSGRQLVPAGRSPSGPAEADAVAALTRSIDVSEAGDSLLRPLAPVMTLNNLTKATRNRWRLALTVGLLLGATLAGAVWFFLPGKYTSYALLRVASTEQYLLPDRQPAASPSDRFFENTQVALIKSRPIILAALRRPKVGDTSIIREQADPAAWLEDELKVGYIDKTDILRIALTGTNPTELALLVNAVKDAYLNHAVDAQRNEKLAQHENLEKACAESEVKLRSKREVLSKLADFLKSGDPQALTLKQKIALDEYAALKKEHSLLEAQIRNAEVTLAVRKNAEQQGEKRVALPNAIIEQALDASPAVIRKRAELDQLDAHIIEAERTVQAGHPTLVRLHSERVAKETEWKRVREEQRTAVLKQVDERLRADKDLKSSDLAENVEIWKAQRALLQKDVEVLGKEAQKIGTTSFELEQRRGELEQAESFYKKLREQKERLEVELQSNNQRISVLSPAEPPDHRDMATKLRATAVAGIAGLFLGLFIVALREARLRRIRTREDVVDEVGIRVVGTLPPVGDRVTAPWLSRWRKSIDPSAVYMASVDAIRSLVMVDSGSPGNGKLLMVTSALAREGKTTLARELAQSLARTGLPTLLIDCDFRRPQLHSIFGLEAGPGLADVLNGEKSVAEAIRPALVDGLSILTIGSSPRGVAQSALVRSMPGLLEGLRGKYEFILLDCCPVLPVADALLLGGLVDGALLSIRAGQSQLPDLLAACERLSALRIPIVGTVLNGVREAAVAYGYDYLAEATA